MIVFHLRKGVRFHDDHEVTAADVRFTYEAIMNPKNLSPRGSDFEPIKRVEVPDPYTVRVVYKRLYSPAINAWTMGILPAHLLSEEALKKEMVERGLSEAARAAFGMRDAGFNRAPIGAGPFRFVEWQGDVLIHLKRNEDLLGRRAGVSGLLSPHHPRSPDPGGRVSHRRHRLLRGAATPGQSLSQGREIPIVHEPGLRVFLHRL